MAHTVESNLRHPAAHLRASLDALESGLVKPRAQEVETLLLLLDTTQAQFGLLEAEGVDLRAESVRWQNLTRRVTSRPSLIARPARALPGGLAALRNRHGKSAGDAVWWGADLAASQRTRRVVTEIVAILLGIPLALAAIYLTVTWLFPPDPAAVATLQAEAAIDQATAGGDPSTALAAAEAAFAAYPDQGALAAWIAVLATVAGDDERAAAADATARTLYADDPNELALTYSDHYARIGDAAASLSYAQEVLARDPENALAWYHQGRAAMLLGDRALALESLERVSTLAADSSPELVVNARMLYAELLRQPDLSILTPPPVNPSPTTDPALTPTAADDQTP